MSTTNINIPKPVIDYNDLLNKPTLVTEHSELNLDDGTNPHGTTKSDVGLSNVDNTSDANKPVSTATQTALDLKADITSISAVGFSNDYDDLDNKPTIPTLLDKHSELILDDGTNPHGTTATDVGLGNVPNLDTTNAVNKAHDAVTLTGTPNYLTIVGQAITRGLIDLANHVTNRLGFSNLPEGTARSIVGRAGSGNGDLGNISAGNNTILGRNGSGDIAFNSATETKQMLSLDNVDNTSDLNKPISTATQTALNAKQDTLVSGTNIKTLEGQSLLGSGNIDLTKSDVGLGNVDNTSDLNKPISTATQTALDDKQDTLVSGTNIKTINGSSVLGSGNIDTAAVNPTSGVIPVNDNGVFVDSLISQISGNVLLNANLRLAAGGFLGTQSIIMGSGTILTYDGSTSDFLFGNFSFPFIRGNYYDPNTFSSRLSLSSNGSTPHLNINSEGNVGIGTTSPSEKLDIQGTIKAQGYKSSDGSTGITQNVNTGGGNTLVIKNGIITQVL